MKYSGDTLKEYEAGKQLMVDVLDMVTEAEPSMVNFQALICSLISYCAAVYSVDVVTLSAKIHTAIMQVAAEEADHEDE